MRIVMCQIRPPLAPPTQECKKRSMVISFLVPPSSFLESICSSWR